MLKSIDLDTAITIMNRLEAHPKKESVPLEQAMGRVLAEDIRASFPMPPFNKSPFDGFAMRAQDVPATLPVTAVIAAGETRIEPLQPGTAVRIFTGAPVPQGADLVIKQEDTVFDSHTVTVQGHYAPGTNVILAGEDYDAGTILARKGDKIAASQLGVFASQGLAALPVYARPKVTILSTGSELTAPGMPRPDWGIYNSSYYTLRGYLEAMGFEVAPPQIIPDDSPSISGAVRAHMESDAALVITTGGASVGDYDYALATAQSIGAEILFWKVHMKPGGALLVSRKEEKVLLGLSGNPAAALMCILTVVQPFLRKLTGSSLQVKELELPIYQEMPKTSRSTRMLRGHLHLEDHEAYFVENSGRGNGNIASFEHCNLIGVIPGKTGPVSAGEMIRVFQMPEDLNGI